MITIFQRATEVHLTKDVAVVSDFLAKKNKDINILLTTIFFDNLKNKIAFFGLTNTKILTLPKVMIGQLSLSIFWYLLLNSKKHSLFVSYHVRYYTLFYGLIYKFCNPKGKIYIKADMGDLDVERVGPLGEGPLVRLNIFLIKCLIGKNFSLSYETHRGAKAADLYFKKFDLQLNIKVIPNGINQSNTNMIDISRKQNLGICVGRLGAPEKNHEMLVKAILRFYKNSDADWSFSFIGPFSDNFARLIKTSNDSIKGDNRINLIGNLDNKDELYSHFEKAKLLLVSSHREGYPLVYPEAAYHGCAIISTPVSSSHEFIVENGFGLVTQDHNEISFCNSLLEFTGDPKIYKDVLEKIGPKRKNLLWPNILCNLDF
tara:strand:- start:754 stop:1872 length:1119 start_codon:yes stop_codon:yes gene_type:complete